MASVSRPKKYGPADLLNAGLDYHYDKNLRSLEAVNHANKDIDKSLTHLNFDLSFNEKGEIVKDQLTWSEMKHLVQDQVDSYDEKLPPQRVRADRKTWFMLEVKCPHEISSQGLEAEEEFFKRSFDCLNRAMDGQLVWGQVHRDEVHTYKDLGPKDETGKRTYIDRVSMTHMDVVGVPYLKEKGCNMKLFMDPARVQRYQDEFHRMVLAEYGIDIHTGLGKSQETVEELKARSAAIVEAEKAKQETLSYKEEAATVRAETASLKAEATEIASSYETEWSALEAVKAEKADILREAKEAEENLKEYKPQLEELSAAKEELSSIKEEISSMKVEKKELKADLDDMEEQISSKRKEQKLLYTSVEQQTALAERLAAAPGIPESWDPYYKGKGENRFVESYEIPAAEAESLLVAQRASGAISGLIRQMERTYAENYNAEKEVEAQAETLRRLQQAYGKGPFFAELMQMFIAVPGARERCSESIASYMAMKESPACKDYLKMCQRIQELDTRLGGTGIDWEYLAGREDSCADEAPTLDTLQSRAFRVLKDLEKEVEKVERNAQLERESGIDYDGDGRIGSRADDREEELHHSRGWSR